MRFFSQSYLYDDPWPIVTLAFFLRYPNPYAAHVISCDVISREVTADGTLSTTRLILKKGNMPRWFPRGIVSRAESWIIEESEVDPFGRVVKCLTKNLDHVKVMQVEESAQLTQTTDGKTLQHTEARIFSRFGWGLTKKIENHGLSRFKANLQRSRDGVSLILSLLHQSRMQTMTMGVDTFHAHAAQATVENVDDETSPTHGQHSPSSWARVKSWFQSPPPAEPPTF